MSPQINPLFCWTMLAGEKCLVLRDVKLDDNERDENFHSVTSTNGSQQTKGTSSLNKLINQSHDAHPQLTNVPFVIVYLFSTHTKHARVGLRFLNEEKMVENCKTRKGWNRAQIKTLNILSFWMMQFDSFLNPIRWDAKLIFLKLFTAACFLLTKLK